VWSIFGRYYDASRLFRNPPTAAHPRAAVSGDMRIGLLEPTCFDVKLTLYVGIGVQVRGQIF